MTSSTGMPRSVAIDSDLLDAVVHLDARRDVERRCRDPGAQRLDDRVAAGHDLARRRAFGRASACGAPRRSAAARSAAPACPCRRRGRVALVAALRLPAGCYGAVLGLRRRPLAFERLTAVAARADLVGPFLALRTAPARGLPPLFLATVRRLQCAPVGVSSMVMPAAASSSRMRSAAAKSVRAGRAAGRRAAARPGRRARSVRRGPPRCAHSGRAG